MRVQSRLMLRVYRRSSRFAGDFDVPAEATTWAARSSRSPSARLAAIRAFSMNDESSRNAERSTKGWLATSKDLRVRRVAAVAPDQILVNLQIGLKIKGVANAPFLLSRQGSQKFPPKYRRIFLRHRTRLGFF